MRKTLLIIILVFIAPPLALAMQQVNYIGELSVQDPLSVTFDQSGTIYVAQKKGIVQVLDADGKQIAQLGGREKKWKTILRKPVGLAYSNNRLYVIDSSLSHIAVFNKKGKFIDKFGRGGSGPKQFSSPRDICVYKGIIYVADTGNNRIQVLGSNGVFLGEVGTVGEGKTRLKEPLSVAVDYRGDIYAADGFENCVKIYTQEGRYSRTIKNVKKARSIAADRNGIFVSDLGPVNIKIFDFNLKKLFFFGSKGRSRAQFGSITNIALNHEGKVFISDLKRDLVHIFQPAKNIHDVNRERIPPPTSVLWTECIPLTEGRQITRIARGRKGEIYAIDRKIGSVHLLKKGVSIKEIVFPEIKAGAIAVDYDSNLWILHKKGVIKAGPDGKEIFRFGSSGSSNGSFSNPGDIAVTDSGAVYVADSGNKRVQVFSRDGVFISAIGKSKDGSCFMKKPVALTVDKEGILYVLDRGKHAVMRLSSQGKLLGEFGAGTYEDPLLLDPIDIALADNKLFVLDRSASDVKIFTKTGGLVRKFSCEGKGNGDIKSPSSIIAMDNINVLVSDTGNTRLQSFLISYTPDVPWNVAATGDTRSINITWDKNRESIVNKYLVYRSGKETDGFELLAQTVDPHYKDNDVNTGTTYFYKVTAAAGGGNESAMSKSVSAVPQKYRASPPQGLQVYPKDFTADLKWQLGGEQFLSFYIIYREKDGEIKEIGRTDVPLFTDKGLQPDTTYTYHVSAVSIDDVEGEKASVSTKTNIATRPPLEIEVLEMQNVFSNTYKVYENDGIGHIRLTNNTTGDISKLKISFSIRNFMDFPSEIELEDLPVGEIRELKIKAVFNNKILDVTEDTPVQTEISASYYSNRKLKTYSKNHTINIFEKHKMTWDDRERIAAFVTTKDSVLLEFTRGIVTQYSSASDPLLYGSVIFNALGVMGLTYMLDPANSYQVTSGKTDFVDYLQYPRETLKRKSGDCDDLVILYSAALESLAINTKFIEVPGHILMMFAIGAAEELGKDNMGGMLVIEDGIVWVPVEVTLVGKSFIAAWENGSKTYYTYKDNGLDIMDLRSAWVKYKPASLPLDKWRPKEVTREEIEKKFHNEFKDIRKINVKIYSKKYFKAIRENPDNVNAYLQLGIVYAEAGELEEAMRIFTKAKAKDHDNSALMNNMGNIYFLKGEYQAAADAYTQSVNVEPGDYKVWVNLAKAYMRLEKIEEARKAFTSAYKIEPKVSSEFRGMSLKLLSSI